MKSTNNAGQSKYTFPVPFVLHDTHTHTQLTCTHFIREAQVLCTNSKQTSLLSLFFFTSSLNFPCSPCFFFSFRITRPCKSSRTPCSVIWSRFKHYDIPLLKNDPYFKWHSSLLGKWNLCSCQPLSNVPVSLLKAPASPFQLSSAQLHESERRFKDKSLQCRTECSIAIFVQLYSP